MESKEEPFGGVKSTTLRRKFIKTFGGLAAGAILVPTSLLFSPPANAFSQKKIKQKVIMLVVTYFVGEWVDKVEKELKKFKKHLDTMFGKDGSGDDDDIGGGESDSDKKKSAENNAKEIAATATAQEASSNVVQTLTNMELAVESQPPPVDMCVSALKAEEQNIQASEMKFAAMKTEVGVGDNYEGSIMPSRKEHFDFIAKLGKEANPKPRLNNTSSNTRTNSTSRVDISKVSPRLSIGTVHTVNGYFEKNLQQGSNNDPFAPVEAFSAIRLFLSDSGIVPDLQKVLDNPELARDSRVTHSLSELNLFVASRSMVETCLNDIAFKRVMSEANYNNVAETMQPYQSNSLSGHYKTHNSSKRMSLIDMLNFDVETSSASPEFVETLTKKEQERQRPTTSDGYEITQGFTPVLAVISSQIAQHQKWELELLEQREMLSQMQSLYSQLVSYNKFYAADKVFHGAVNYDPLFNFDGEGNRFA